jgi:hypothetical protein
VIGEVQEWLTEDRSILQRLRPYRIDKIGSVGRVVMAKSTEARPHGQTIDGNNQDGPNGSSKLPYRYNGLKMDVTDAMRLVFGLYSVRMFVRHAQWIRDVLRRGVICPWLQYCIKQLQNHRLKVNVPQRRYQFFRLRQEECREI